MDLKRNSSLHNSARTWGLTVFSIKTFRTFDRSASKEWPPSSPDLTFLIFILWTFVKDIAYVFSMLDNVVGLKIRISKVTMFVHKDILDRT